MPTPRRTQPHSSSPRKAPPSPKCQRMSNREGEGFKRGAQKWGDLAPHQQECVIYQRVIKPLMHSYKTSEVSFLRSLQGANSFLLDSFCPAPTPSPDFSLLNEAIQLSPNFSHKHSCTLSKTGLSSERRVLTIVAHRRPHVPHSYPK